jgi:hypothetical protein
MRFFCASKAAWLTDRCVRCEWNRLQSNREQYAVACGPEPFAGSELRLDYRYQQDGDTNKTPGKPKERQWGVINHNHLETASKEIVSCRGVRPSHHRYPKQRMDKHRPAPQTRILSQVCLHRCSFLRSQDFALWQMQVPDATARHVLRHFPPDLGSACCQIWTSINCNRGLLTTRLL